MRSRGRRSEARGYDTQARDDRDHIRPVGDSCRQQAGIRPDGFLGRMGAGAGRRQHRQPVRRRVPRHPDEPGGVASRAGVERLALHVAGVAVPAARRDVHLAWAVAGPPLEGNRSEFASDQGVSRRVAAVRRQPVLHGRTRAPAGAGATLVGRVLDGRVRRRHAQDHDDASEGRLLSAERRAVER